MFYELPVVRRVPNPELMLAKKAYDGKMTQHSQRRIMRAVDMLLQRSPTKRIFNPVINKAHDFRISFVTLTIPDKTPVPASFAHKNLLEPFLRTSRRKFSVTDYIWKAELQERGQLHYHITWNQFVEFTRIRAEWNKLLRKHRLSDDYAKRFGHFNPNSIDVHAVWKVRNLKAYLAKYISKTEAEKARLDGKVWDCSKELKRNFFTITYSNHHDDILREGVELGLVKTWSNDHVTIFKLDNPASVLTQQELAQYKAHIA